MGHLFQEGGCDEKEPRGRGCAGDLVASVLMGRTQHLGAMWSQMPWATTVPEPPCFLIWNRDLSCLQVTKAGSRLPCGEGLSFLGTWRVGRGRGERRGGKGFQLTQALGGQCTDMASQSVAPAPCLFLSYPALQGDSKDPQDLRLIDFGGKQKFQ